MPPEEAIVGMLVCNVDGETTLSVTLSLHDDPAAWKALCEKSKLRRVTRLEVDLRVRDREVDALLLGTPSRDSNDWSAVHASLETLVITGTCYNYAARLGGDLDHLTGLKSAEVWPCIHVTGIAQLLTAPALETLDLHQHSIEDRGETLAFRRPPPEGAPARPAVRVIRRQLFNLQALRVCVAVAGRKLAALDVVVDEDEAGSCLLRLDRSMTHVMSTLEAFEAADAKISFVGQAGECLSVTVSTARPHAYARSPSDDDGFNAWVDGLDDDGDRALMRYVATHLGPSVSAVRLVDVAHARDAGRLKRLALTVLEAKPDLPRLVLPEGSGGLRDELVDAAPGGGWMRCSVEVRAEEAEEDDECDDDDDEEEDAYSRRV